MRCVLALASLAALVAADADTDNDGLSDFQERHKYFTDAETLDSDGDGTPDGDWTERREYTYTIRSVVRVMPPYNKEALNDAYQDARIRAETDKYIELEVIHYPLTKYPIEGDRNWRQTAAGLKRYLEPGVTTNWDASMRRALLKELERDGIDPGRLTDKEVVEQVSKWLFRKSKFVNMFCTYYVHFPRGKARILPGCERNFERDKGDKKWSTKTQLERELFGKGMYKAKTHGTCTSSAVYLTTVLRAVGIPTRMVLGVPFLDASRSEQVAMLERVTHHRLRNRVSRALLGSGSSFAAHTYNEVFVGGRWRRLNYSTLGATPTSTFGLMTHVHRFHDLSEARLAETWGKRYAQGERDEVFAGSNPYATLEVSDLFGPHSNVENAAVREHHHLTISKVYWWFSDQRPQWLAADKVPMRDQGAHVLFHVDEWFAEQNYTQLKLFMSRADKDFVLRAAGHPDVRAHLSTGYYTHATTGDREFHLLIPKAEYARMAKGVDYTLRPAKARQQWEWRVNGGLSLRRN